MVPIDYSLLSQTLRDLFDLASSPNADANVILSANQEAFDTVFQSNTQSYREVLLGCALVHLLYPDRDIRLIYMKQGERAFNGRNVDEKVVNPFLNSKQIPCSKGPYLATFRRNVKLDETAREGLRDKNGYDAMLRIVHLIEQSEGLQSQSIILALLQKFIELRENSTIQIVSVARLSIPQYSTFVDLFLKRQSGGLIPMLLTEALFQTINQQCRYGWEILRQGINAADGATGAAGDITIMENGAVIKAIEVTERPILSSRVVATFNTKISVHGTRDYLFVYTDSAPEDEALQVAKTYFAQGYDVNFVRLRELIISTFICGSEYTRSLFMNIMLSLLEKPDVPASVKIAWNDALQSTIAV